MTVLMYGWTNKTKHLWSLEEELEKAAIRQRFYWIYTTNTLPSITKQDTGGFGNFKQKTRKSYSEICSCYWLRKKW